MVSMCSGLGRGIAFVPRKLFMCSVSKTELAEVEFKAKTITFPPLTLHGVSSRGIFTVRVYEAAW